MRKKLTALLASMLVLVAFCLSACGGAAGEVSSGESTDAAQASGDGAQDTASGGEASGSYTKLVVSMLAGGQPPEDLPLVTEAVNEITRERLNAEVEFFPITMGEAQQSKFSLMIAGGEQLDLICVPFVDPFDYVSSGLLEPLNDLLQEHAPAITELAAENPLILSTATFDGEVYGVTPYNATYGNSFGMIASGNHLAETGLPLKDRHEKYTLEEVTALFAKVKELHPDMYPMALNTTNTKYKSFFPVDMLGATHASGVLLDYDRTEILNLFETQEFLDYCLQMREWYEMGLIMPDVDTTDGTFVDELLSGRAACYYEFVEPIQLNDDSPFGGWGSSIPVQVTDNYTASISPSDVVNWVVPSSSADPALAVKLLDMLYSDHDFANLIFAGIEDTHWVAVDDEGHITFPEGLDSSNSPYVTTYGIWGDRRYEYQYSEGVTREVNDEYTERNRENQFMAVGYKFNSAQYTNEIVTIETVLETYLPSLGFGVVPNVEETIAKMNEELKIAGIEKVIAANQEQFDAWLASNG